jgi:hydrogenase expression/formation protein HypD
MLYEGALRNKKFIKETIERIRGLGLKRKVNLMEVCGTHTYTFFRFGLRGLLSPYVNLISGPGCPVCITENSYIDKAIYLSKDKKNVIATFGDLMRVRGSSSSLYQEKARGANIEVVYSPYQTLEYAIRNKDKRIIFLGVGFETTAPLIASVVRQARKKGLKNFFVLVGHRLIPPAMEALCQDPQINVEGFICPGHVSTIIGSLPYRAIVEKYKKGCVICGFEPLDVVLGIYMLLLQVKKAKPRLENEYRRVVKKEGNITARKIMYEVFKIGDGGWRGIGVIKKSGLHLRDGYKNFDAQRLIKVSLKEKAAPDDCLCGEVIKGKIIPYQCPQFKKRCMPSNPVGPCMVSLEGTCRIYYEYGEGESLEVKSSKV